MEASVSPEPINEEGFAAFSARTGDGTPVVMLNLLAFKPDGGQERYMEYGAAVAPLLEKAGGRIVWAGSPAAALLGDDSWDLVALVEYPTRQAFLEMIGSPEYPGGGPPPHRGPDQGRAAPDGSRRGAALRTRGRSRCQPVLI